MHLVRQDDSRLTAANNPLFIGEAALRPLVSADVSSEVSIALVHFKDGARNKRHTHSADQVLYITAGDGIVADDNEELWVSAGDLVHVHKGVVHWHGAQPGKDMSHLSIIAAGASTDAAE